MSVPRIVVDPDSGIAPWRQLHDQILWLVGTGRLRVGAQLPTIRQLARDLGLAPGTVARAYRELESARVLRTARRNGTEVAGLPTDRPPLLEPLAAATESYVAAAKAAGADVQQAVAAVIAAFEHG